MTQTAQAPLETVVQWVEANLGGRVTTIREQGRWRTAWFFELEKNNERKNLYFRGHRPGLGKDSRRLKMEMDVLTVLKAQGIPVPAVYGLCPDPEGIVMEHCPGRANLATAVSDTERRQVLDEYIDALVKMHAIDLQQFQSADLFCPSSSEERGLADINYWESAYRSQRARLGEFARPEPLIEFALDWLKQHVPENRHETVFLHVDAGQFVFDKGHLTALLDFELSMLGDPASDLAGLRTRDLSEPLGDLSRAFKRYRKKSGRDIPAAVVDYHTIRFAMMTPLPIAALCAKPPPGVNLVQYLGWYYTYSRIAIELIASLEGVKLDEPTLPAEISLTVQTQGSESAEQRPDYEADVAQRNSEYQQRLEAFGPAMAQADGEELAALLEKRFDNLDQAMAALETRVLDKCLSMKNVLPFFYRHCQRQLFILGPGLRELQGVRLQSLQ